MSRWVGWAALIVLVGGLSAGVIVARRSKHAPRATPVLPDGGVDVGRPPPPGSLCMSETLYAFTIYHLSPPPGDLDGRIAALAKKIRLRVAVQKNEHTDLPTVRVVHLAVADSWLPEPRIITQFGRGVDEPTARRLASASAVTMLVFRVDRAHVLGALKQAQLVAHEVAKLGDAIILDEETRQFFTPKEWKSRRIDDWNEVFPDTRAQVTIHWYRDGELDRSITLGMVKFGLPDLVVEGHGATNAHSVGSLLNLTCQTLIEGGEVDRDGRVHLDIDRLKRSALRKSLVDSLLEGATRRADVALLTARHDQGDPVRVLEIIFPGEKSTASTERQEALLGTLLGKEDSITYVSHDDEMLGASQRAKKKLSVLRGVFRRGLAPGERLQVKAPFDAPNGGHEWMWIEVRTWKGGKLGGVLENDPALVENLKAGAIVSVDEESVFDYIFEHADGTREGNETGKLMQQREAKKQGR